MLADTMKPRPPAPGKYNVPASLVGPVCNRPVAGGRFVYATLFLTWFAFAARFYVGYFLVASGPIDFLNHPLVQIPCLNHIPAHMSN